MGEIIKNEEIKVPKNCYMNESDILNDILISYKHLVTSYGIALNEASNKKIYKLFMNNFQTISNMQAELFECAFKKGWYQLESAEPVKINQTYKKYQKKVDEFSCDFESKE